MIEQILPSEVAATEALHDPPGAVLFPEEETVIAPAVDKRRREFTTVRHCARLSMARLGLPAAPLLPRERGAPQWPAGVVGSMTHCTGYRAAAVGLAASVVTVGIDAEPHEPLPSGVLDIVALPSERARLRTLSTVTPAVHWDRLLFSAKEAVYKAWFPLAGTWLDFEQAEITIDPHHGTFTAGLRVPGPVVDGRALTGFNGRWMVRQDLVLTTITVLRRSSPASWPYAHAPTTTG